MTDANAAAETKPGAEDLFEIFYAPSAVFERRRGGEFGLPLVALVVLGAILLFATKGLLQPVFDAETAVGLARKASQMTPEQMAAAKSFAGTATIIGIPLTYFLAPFILGGILWLIARAVGVKPGYSVAVMIATFAWYPRLIEWITSAVQMAVMPNMTVTSRLSLTLGAGRFLDGTHPSLATALLGRVDLFTLWVSFLFGLGCMVAARASRGEAIAIGAMMWLVGAMPQVIGVLMN